MDEITSNIDDIGKWLDGLVDSFNFTTPGKDQSLGRDLAGVVAQGIIDRSVPDAVDPKDNPWPENEPKYAAWKKKKYDAVQPGIRTGQMLSLASVLGTPTITADTVSLTYGLGEPPSRAANATELTKGDKAVTDREKAGYFTEGGRAFYEVDDIIAAEVIREAGEVLAEYLEKK